MEEPTIAQRTPIVIDIEPGVYFWCSCGKSAKQPYCDGSHKGSSFAPVKEEVTEAKRVAWCGCKHSQNAPFCDGSHTKL